jgi:argininosuccinate lyase
MKMWSGRFRDPLDPAFERWQRSFPFDQRLLRHELQASRVYARALKKADVLSLEELASIESGLDRIAERALIEPDFLNNYEAEDVHHFVEMQLMDQLGDVGRKLHSGRSRNEQIATDLRLYVRESIDQLSMSLAELLETFVTRAELADEAAMPSYTHLQRAEPVLVAHWLLAYVEMFCRDSERLQDCRKRVNWCPLGCGAVAGSTLPLDRHAMAADLDFDGPTANSIDAISERDFVVEYVNAISILALHLSRWAEEMILFSTAEFGLVEPPESFSTGSSAMPQKKNPDLLELTRGKAGRILGDATALQITLKGLPMAYNKDLQETQEPLFDASETMLALVPLIAEFLQKVQFKFARMQNAVEFGFMNAFAAATYLTEKGVPFRSAHEHIGKAVQLCLEKNCELKDLALSDLRQINSAFDNDFFPRLSVQAVLAVHNVVGGTALERVKQAVAEARQKISAMRGPVHAHA